MTERGWPCVLPWVGCRKALRLAPATSALKCPEIPDGCGRIGTGCRMVSLIGACLDGSRLSFLSSRVCQGRPRLLPSGALMC